MSHAQYVPLDILRNVVCGKARTPEVYIRRWEASAVLSRKEMPSIKKVPEETEQCAPFMEYPLAMKVNKA